ncbi:MAG: hypothetical protein F4X65_04380 [Chloroflexi bacterium]|nr:hypothetical protein [Chloroflexota bacterium]
MGTVMVTIEVGDPQGSEFREVELTVDTGSTFTALPARMLRELGVKVDETVPSDLADGTTTPVDIGWTMVKVEGKTFPTNVIFAGENEPGLLGVVTLEQALLAVDPIHGRLVPVNARRY